MILRRNALLPILALLPLGGLLYCAAGAAPPKKAAPKPIVSATSFEKSILPVIDKNCVMCHTAKDPSGGIVLEGDTTSALLLKHRETWERVAANVESGHMPPEGMPKPTQAERDRVTQFVRGAISKAECQLNDPGRVTMRRLNRAEYNNTIRDLLLVDMKLADEFPSDDVGYGFDNIGDVLTISPLLMEKYLRAGERVARAAIRTPEDAKRPVVYKPNRLLGGNGDGDSATGKSLFSPGEIYVEYDFPFAGNYELVVGAWGDQAGPEPVRMSFRMDDHDLRTVDVPNKRPRPFTVPLKIDFPGKHKIAVAFINDYYNTTSPDPKLRGDRNMYVESFTIKNPQNISGLIGEPPASHRRIITCKPTDNDPAKDVCTQTITRNFAQRAYRRPVTDSEVSRLTRYVGLAKQSGESWERGIQLMVQAVLVSPNFLFRVETDNSPNSATTARKLNDYELASRLSYFLWSSMPDDTLLALAAKKRLSDPDVLLAQTKRMLKDPKAHALTDNFAGQWLQLRSLNIVSPDTQRFPQWNDYLRRDMRTETEMFFNYVVNQDRPITDFLDAKYTFLNARLAKLYGNTSVTGDAFQKVALSSGQRGGLLSQASVLTVTSNPTRTSPVKRGKWVLDNILGTPPPPAPPNIPKLPDDDKKPLVGTLRQRMEQHRKNPICASCHRNMDPIGFGLENYDAIGAWRTMDAGAPLDSSGTLTDGRSFRGPAQLKKLLLNKKDLFAHALTERMLTYALGRGIETYDHCNLNAMAQRVAQREYRFSAVIGEIVLSRPFRERRGDGTPNKPKVARN